MRGWCRRIRLVNMVPLSLHASHGYQTVRHFKPNLGTGGVVVGGDGRSRCVWGVVCTIRGAGQQSADKLTVCSKALGHSGGRCCPSLPPPKLLVYLLTFQSRATLSRPPATPCCSPANLGLSLDVRPQSLGPQPLEPQRHLYGHHTGGPASDSSKANLPLPKQPYPKPFAHTA